MTDAEIDAGVAKEDKMKASIALASACLAVVPVAAAAETHEDQMACMNDAFTVCGHAIPDRDRVAACLSQNFSRLSDGCRAVMTHYSRSAPRTRSRISSVRD